MTSDIKQWLNSIISPIYKGNDTSVQSQEIRSSKVFKLLLIRLQ